MINEDDRMVIYANSNVSRGKYAAAAVHAALTAMGVHHGGPVIVLGAKPHEIETHRTVIHDAGKTEVEPGTVTAGTDWQSTRPEPPVTNIEAIAAAAAYTEATGQQVMIRHMRVVLEAARATREGDR